MPYTPTPGVFVNGLIIDGPDLLNEFGLIASALSSQELTLRAKISESLNDAKTYTDEKTTTLEIDGGTV